MFDPPISSGANLFIIIAVALIAFGAALTLVDVIKSGTLDKEKEEEKK